MRGGGRLLHAEVRGVLPGASNGLLLLHEQLGVDLVIKRIEESTRSGREAALLARPRVVLTSMHS